MDPRSLLNMGDTDVSLTDWPEEYDPSQENQEDAAWQQEVSASGTASFDQKVAEWGKDELQSQLKIWNDPACWSETYLSHPDDPFKPLKLKNFQKDIINDWHPNIAVRLPRQQGKSVLLCCRALWYCLRYPGKTFLIATPTRAQVWRLFEILSNMAHNFVQEKQIKITRGNPMIVRFANGSKAIGFTAGTKSGRKAFGIRGQMAHVLAMDECVSGTTHIDTLIGKKLAQDIQVGDSILSWTGHHTNYEKVVAAKCTGVKNTISLKMETGDSITCTPNHPILSAAEYLPASVVEHVSIPLLYPYINQKDAITSRLCGILFGDGWLYAKAKVAGFSGDVTGLQCVATDIKTLFPQYSCTINSRETYSPKWGIQGITNSFSISADGYALFNELGVPVGDKTKIAFGVPTFIMEGAALVKTEFLSALFGAEGATPNLRTNGVTPRAITLRMHKIPAMADSLCAFFNQLVALLADLGVVASYKLKHRPGLTSYCVLTIKNDEANHLRFLETVGYRYCPRKEELATIQIAYCKYKRTVRQQLQQLYDIARQEVSKGKSINSTAKKYGIMHLDKWLRAGTVSVCTPHNIQSYGDWCAARLQTGRLLLKVTTKTAGGRQLVYNFTVDGAHTYLANGIITHNCDHLSEGDVSTLLAIKNNLKSALHVWMSSTPTGERKQFFHVCTKPKEHGFHAYHYLPTQIEGYDPVSDAQLRALMPLEEYEHECQAIFGAISSGVFRPDYVDNAIQGYEPPFIDGVLTTHAAARYLPIKPDCVYVIGVDWNTSTVGQAITVVEWNATKKKARIWLQEEQPNKDFSHTDAVKRIVALTKLLNAPYICVDYGFGDSDIEQLKLYDKEHPGLDITKRLFIINFGTDIEVIDPETKLETKKDTKPYIINSAVRMFENNMIELPKFWDYKNRLVDDLRNYMILRRTETGAITYTKLNDHRLISYVLALFAISHKDNLLLPGRSGYLTKVILRSSSIWANNADKHISHRTFSPEDTKYFNHKAPVLNTHFNEEKYDSNALSKLKKKDATQFRHPQQTSSRTSKIQSGIPGRGLRNTSTRNRF